MSARPDNLGFASIQQTCFLGMPENQVSHQHKFHADCNTMFIHTGEFVFRVNDTKEFDVNNTMFDTRNGGFHVSETR